LILASAHLIIPYQKAGLTPERFKDVLKLPDDFFEDCRSKAPQGKRSLYPGLINHPHVLKKNGRCMSWKIFGVNPERGVL
jgi:hypothetical protein